MRVLIVDDEPDDLKEMESLIGSTEAPDGKFYDVKVTDKYEEALSIVEKETFDIVVTDMVMGKNQDEGIEILKNLADKSAVVIFITAYPSIPNCVQAMRAGAWDYIEKIPQDGTDSYERLIESVHRACEYRLKNPERCAANPDSEWVHEHIDELIEKYPGKLVAVLYEKVIDSDPSFAELSKRIQSKSPLTKPTIVSIPRPRESI